jgi:5-dehydro-2-deoxygluconokinase
MHMALDLVTAGRISADLYPLERGSIETVHRFEKLLGGSPVNVAAAAARLGTRAAAISKTGDDPFGRFCRTRLAELGVDNRFLGIAPGRTPVSFCELFPPDDFPIHFYRDANSPDMQLSPADFSHPDIVSSRLMWVTGTGYSQPHSRTTHETVLAGRSRDSVALDLDLRPSLWERPDQFAASMHHAIGQAGIVVGNREECQAVLGPADPHRLAELLLERGVNLAVIKLGPHGVIAKTHDQSIAIRAFQVDVTNGLGAGDAFGGALCHGVLEGWPLDQTIRFAAAAGAIVASRLGCSDVMANTSQIEALMARQFV